MLALPDRVREHAIEPRREPDITPGALAMQQHLGIAVIRFEVVAE
jgi:hypothetical protein